MSKYRYYISLYIIIPIIFAGLSVLSVIVSFRITEHYMKQEINLTYPILLWATIIASIAFICGLIVVKLFLKPVQVFIEKTKKLPVLSIHGVKADKGSKGDEMQRFTHVFQKVTDVLSKVDAQQLFPKILGQSVTMREVLSQIMRVAPTDSTVLILGESGTGKELIATSIYDHSHRSDKPFVKINCVAIPEELLESELFGFEKGAFTGAVASKPGKFEIANQGTIFLDEIGDMPINLQAKLLRVIQEREFDRIGGSKPVKIDVRFIAATNKDLESMVAEGSFREDLFYRLNVFTLKVPSLRERKEDIPLLVESFLKKAPKSSKIYSLPMQLLMGYAWPGNIRELQNTMERAAVMSDTGIIDVNHLPENIKELLNTMENAAGMSDGEMIEEHHLQAIIAKGPSLETSTEIGSLSIDDQLRTMEKRMIIEALKKAEGVQVRAAEILGIDQRSLWHRVKKHSINSGSYAADKK
jgi:transcriptional regulator with PAS, ATPase and Fis domain